MKVPLRFQVTEFDCGTISLLNVFSYLFEREELPAALVKAIHKYTLDCYDEEGNIGQGGTSREAIDRLTHWITRYTNEHDFKIKCIHLQQEDVTLDKMNECLVANDKLVMDMEGVSSITSIFLSRTFIFIFYPVLPAPQKTFQMGHPSHPEGLPHCRCSCGTGCRKIP